MGKLLRQHNPILLSFFRSRSYLNRHLRVRLTDGRSVVGTFLCTDRDANVILGSCTETKADRDKDRGDVRGRPEEPRQEEDRNGTGE